MSAAEFFAAGARHAEQREFGEAARCFRSVLEIEPENPYALNGLGVSLHELGDLGQAARSLGEAIRIAPDFNEAHYNLGLVELERERLDAALACFEEILQKEPADADALAASAMAFERKNQFDDAEAYFADAAEFSEKYEVARMLRFSREFLSQIDAAKPESPAPILAVNNAASCELAALIACDPVYLRKYGPAFARSFAQHAPGDLLHLHVLNPDAGALDNARAMLSDAGVVQYRVSSERNARFAQGSRAEAVWYTCARFSLLEWYVHNETAMVAVLDIDAVLTQPFAPMLAALGTAELAMALRQPRRAPWLDVVANTLIAKPTPATARFARLVCAYIEYFNRQGKPAWHLDQCALYCVWRMLTVYGGAPEVRSLWDAQQQAFFHLGHSYDEKMADPRYKKFVKAGL